MLTLLAIPAAWVLFELVWVATGEPAADRDYAAELRALVASVQRPGPDGWSTLLAAAVDADRIHDEISAQAEADGAAGRPEYTRVLRTSPGELPELSWEQRAFAAMRDEGVFDRLAEVAVAPRFGRPVPAEDLLQGMLLPELAPIRSLARIRTASMRAALHAGDSDEAAAALEQVLAITRAMAAQPLLIDRLVATGVGRLVVDQLRQATAELELDAATARALLAAMDRQLPLAPASHAFAGERLFALNAVDEFFTDDGHGDGCLRPELLPQVLGQRRGNSLADILAFGSQAGRAESTELLEEFYELLIAEADLPPVERAKTSTLSSTAFWAKLGWRHVVLQTMLPNLAIRVVQPDDDLRAHLAGVRVLLALEAFRDERGAFPASLDELVPGFLARAPVDPTTGGPFRYRPPETPGADYLLYSVGADGTDHLAKPSPDPGGEYASLADLAEGGVWDTGFDMVINIPRGDDSSGESQ
ncbi:MAG: hypothetical protein ACYTJ0_14950 [Planctomycetota bacterium]|jgi:hypothetical protein